VSCRAKSIAAAALFLSAAVPSLGWASSGGPSGGAGIGGSAPGGALASTNIVQSGDVSVSASGNGISVTSVASAILRKQLQFSGSVPASNAGRQIVIERNGHETGWTWEPTVTTTAQSDGSFTASWTTDHIGRFDIRVVIGSTGPTASAAAVSPPMTVTVYRPSIATQYGPGFWGKQTACGQKLTRATLGVANRTLKCGTDVALLYHGRTLIVPVIDRGPYANNADWDLTEATGKALGIDGTTTLGAVSLPAQPKG
jgi:rare lipoprotein A